MHTCEGRLCESSRVRAGKTIQRILRVQRILSTATKVDFVTTMFYVFFYKNITTELCVSASTYRCSRGRSVEPLKSVESFHRPSPCRVTHLDGGCCAPPSPTG